MAKSKEYLEAVLDNAKEHLPDWLFQEIHKLALPSAGGRARQRKIDGPDPFAKIALEEIRPARLRRLPDDELRQAWLRLNQWLASFQQQKKPVEDVVNAGLWTLREFERRGFKVDEGLELTKLARKLGNTRKELDDLKIENLPRDVVVVPNFINIVGSAAAGGKEPDDIDVLFRAKRDEDGEHFLIESQNVWLPVRNVLDADKQDRLHFIDGPQGAHGDHVPLYDLVLRRKDVFHVEMIKGFPNEVAEAGVHVHNLERENRKTKNDGAHRHVVHIGDVVIASDIDGAHPHELEEDVANRTKPKSGTHKHRIVLPAGLRLPSGKMLDEETELFMDPEPDGHEHQLQAWSSAFDGIHSHELQLPDNTSIWTPMPGRYWVEHGRPSQANVPPAPGAPALALLAKGEDLKIDLGAGGKAPDGFMSVDRDETTSPDVVADLEQGIPFPDDSVAVARAHHVLEHLTDKEGIMREIHRVLQPGGLLDFEIPSTRGEGAFAHPDHKSFWNRSTFAFFSNDRLLENRPRFEIIKLEEIEAGDAVYVRGVLRKPIETEKKDADLLKQRAGVKDPDVPSTGKVGAKVLFVGSSPSRADMLRKEPLVGPDGAIFETAYLKELHLSRSEVALTNAVPVHLTDDEGQTREPKSEEVDAWSGWFGKEVQRLRPGLIVALGQTAAKMLEKRADFVLPHPAVIRRFGDRGELARKIKKLAVSVRGGIVRKVLDSAADCCDGAPLILLKQRAPKSEGGAPGEPDTRGEAAEKFWRENWHRMFPRSGKGRFVYHHHWRGLDAEENETALSDEQLMQTRHSVHGDLRLTADDPDELWGFAALIGSTVDNRKLEQNDKLIAKPKNIRLAPKLAQPRPWLTIANRKPFVADPGEAGSTRLKSSKFFDIDTGTYELGVWHRNVQEIFLDGKHLKGRFLIQSTPFEGGRRVWLIEKPDDQKPMAETKDLEKVLSERRAKRRKFLVWAKPGERPKLLDVRTGRVIKGEEPVPILKRDTQKQIVYGIPLSPHVVGDHQDNDWVPPGDIEEAVHRFMKGPAIVAFRHRRPIQAKVVESVLWPYPSQQDYHRAIRGLPHRAYRQKVGRGIVRSGDWYAGVHIGDKRIWRMVEEGELNEFSAGGLGMRIPISSDEVPEVTFIDVGEA